MFSIVLLTGDVSEKYIIMTLLLTTHKTVKALTFMLYSVFVITKQHDNKQIIVPEWVRGRVKMIYTAIPLSLYVLAAGNDS